MILLYSNYGSCQGACFIAGWPCLFLGGNVNLERCRSDFRNSIVGDDYGANWSSSPGSIKQRLTINHDVRRFGFPQDFHHLGARHPHSDGSPTLQGPPGRRRNGPGSGKDRTLLGSHCTFQTGKAPILIRHHTLQQRDLFNGVVQTRIGRLAQQADETPTNTKTIAPTRKACGIKPPVPIL